MTDKPKILFIDIENTPLISYTWGRYEQNVVDIQQESYILSMAYKWLDEKKTSILSLPKYIGYKPNTIKDDEKLVKDIHDLFNKADIIVAHNGDAFDIKKINARFIYYGLKPVSPFKTVDTLKVARRHFAFSSNRLNDLGKLFKVGQKVRTGGFDLWLECMAGNKKSWGLMVKYNIQDVVLLEKVYKKLLPYMTNHPVYGNYTQKINTCPNCGSDHLQYKGSIINRSTRYRRLHCQNCGAWSKELQLEKGIKPLVGV